MKLFKQFIIGAALLAIASGALADATSKVDVTHSGDDWVYCTLKSAQADIFPGAFVEVDTTAYCSHAGDDASVRLLGVSLDYASAGDSFRVLTRGEIGPYTHTTGSLTNANIGDVVCLSDDQTVDACTATTNDLVAGTIAAVPSASTVTIAVGFDPRGGASLSEVLANFAGVTASDGSNDVGYDDSGSKTSAATVGNALDELYVNATTTLGTIDLMPYVKTLSDGTALAQFSNGASATPGWSLLNSEALGLRWNNNGSLTAVAGAFIWPYDLDNTANATVEVLLSKTGATVGDNPYITFTFFNHTVAALEDADSDYGGNTGAITGDATAKMIQKVTLTLTAADLPAPGTALAATSFSMVPQTDLGTDDLTIYGVQIKYKKKILAQ